MQLLAVDRLEELLAEVCKVVLSQYETADNIAHDFGEEALEEFASRRLCNYEFRNIEGAIRRVVE
ncbi:MAG TPA: hypothetical protein VH394_07705 [Thermoanaerobaculia bacterium]|nr:hypothetical protein [Thermoanaerobaculia bacterium]